MKGVAGAQLSGAGLGGCVMILVEEGAVDALVAKLESEYYAPRGLEPGLTVCIPVKVLEFWRWYPIQFKILLIILKMLMRVMLQII